MSPRYHRATVAFAALTIAMLPAIGAPASGAAPTTASASASTPASAAPAKASAATLIVDGAGDGHGVGMSQEGALGYAQHGWSYQAILAHYYTGTALGSAPPHAIVKVLLHGKVHRIPLERYVRGVVAAEVSADWPTAALEAQAVASRTYALTAHAGGAKFDVYADTRSQMYLGKAAETPPTNAAVAATAGQIVTYGGQPAVTYFFASSGGRTESVQDAFPGSSPEPWLVGVDDPYDSGPLHRWKLSFGFHAVGVRLKGLVKGAFRGIVVLSRGTSPRILTAEVLGSKGRTKVTGAQLAERLGLYDSWAYFYVSDSHGTHPEPDRSGKPSAEAPPPTPATATSASHVTGEGGVSAPTSGSASGGSTPGGSAPDGSTGSVTGQGGIAAPSS